MFIKLTNQEQTNLLMVLAAIFCLWVVWKLVNHRHNKITGEVMNSGNLRRLLPRGSPEGMTTSEADQFRALIDDLEETGEEEQEQEQEQEQEEEKGVG